MTGFNHRRRGTDRDLLRTFPSIGFNDDCSGGEQHGVDGREIVVLSVKDEKNGDSKPGRTSPASGRA